MPVLEVSVGHASASGSRPRNEDYFGFSAPDGEERAAKGIVLAVADGVGGNAGGREASKRWSGAFSAITMLRRIPGKFRSLSTRSSPPPTAGSTPTAPPTGNWRAWPPP